MVLFRTIVFTKEHFKNPPLVRMWFIRNDKRIELKLNWVDSECGTVVDTPLKMKYLEPTHNFGQN